MRGYSQPINFMIFTLSSFLFLVEDNIIFEDFYFLFLILFDGYPPRIHNLSPQTVKEVQE